MRADRTDDVIKVNAPLRSDIKILRILICCGITSMLIFIYWFINPDHMGYAPIFWLLTFALIFKLVKMLHEWYHYWSPSIPEKPAVTKEWTVDVLTTSCPGEPREMIIRTLKAMTEIRYPHTNYLCDEGDDPVLRQVCADLGIVHVTRVDKKDAKAGNINNALKQAKGEICLVLDPDHIPVPEFLDQVLPYFEDEKIGFVQCVQGYYNQSESFIARGAAEQTYHFYGPMMMSMNSYGTVQAIGANCTFRREALDSIGGHAAGLSEDMHTAMQLHAKGWKSVYVPEMLTKGLVPATLSSYYKQQLKWSRGTFELLFRTFPKLYKNFTWRQKLHYFTIPLYFLFGLINLIDIAVPALALGIAEVPWELDLAQFAMIFFPVCFLSMTIRLYAQRWLLEKHERGLHFAGGILRTATWWIFLVGFIYTIFKIKVPYIPTPKEDEHQNYFVLSIPNIIVLVISTIVMFYGLSIDWTPYSFAMASYSCITISILAFTVLLSQQKFLMSVGETSRKIPFLNIIAAGFGAISARSNQLVHYFLRNGAIALFIAFSLVFLSYNGVEDGKETNSAIAAKDLGGFYLGAELLPDATDAEEVFRFEKNIRSNFNVVSIKQNWGDTAGSFLMSDIKGHGGMPFIVMHAEELADSLKKNLFSDIAKGKYDDYLKRSAALFRAHKEPVFITITNFHANAKDKVDESSSEQFVKGWQYVYTFFNRLGISNLTWVWCPEGLKNTSSYPEENFVDWIGVSCLNYGKDQKASDWNSFNDIYAPFRNTYGRFQKPVMITNFGSVAGSGQETWYNDALEQIQNKYEEIGSIILFNGKKGLANFSVDRQSTCNVIHTQLQGEAFTKRSKGHAIIFNKADANYSSDFVKGSPGNFQLLINNRPYYIQGVAYNTAHDWRDGNMPLTRRQVEKDFTEIREMGANTIRRYGTGIYDRNVLNIAEEFDLNVLYGFWFDPKTDFYADSVKVQEYMDEVEEKVLQYKDHSSVMAWSLGNESWGLLKHRYAKPYLTKVRNSYVRFIEHLAQRIHQLDPGRPVFTGMEHEEFQLQGEIVAFHDGAPSLDVIGINSYYKEQITTLNHIAWEFDSLRPYLVSEFGPRGYWNAKYNAISDQSLIEETDSEKAKWYTEQWKTYVKGYEGFNVGGFAYCWHDRMEGSYTWFGLTDYKGRRKPAYYALKEQWANEKQTIVPQFYIQGPDRLLPGNVYSFAAVARGGKIAGLKYEWKLLKDEYLDQINNIEVKNDPASIGLTIPTEPSEYRLYLFVSDEEDQNVTTASIPVSVSKK